MSEQALFVILPAFNEAVALSALIPAVAQQWQGNAFQIILVDDASTDETPALAADWAKSMPLTHLRHASNQGYGAAIRTGVLYAQSHARPDDIILTLDADNTHLPRYFPPLVERINNGFDVVTASYVPPGGKAFGVPIQRRILSWGINVLFRGLTPTQGTRLYTNGFRAWRARIIQTLVSQYGENIIEENGFPGGVELFLKARRLGFRDTEIPFELHYENRGGGTKIRIGHTIRAYLKLIGRFI